MNDYDEFFAEFYKYESEKIPKFLHFSKKKIHVITIIMVVCFCISFTILSVVPDYRESFTLDFYSATGGEYGSYPISTYSNLLLTLVIVFMIPVALFAGWIWVSMQIERRAFKIASGKAAQAVEFKRKREKDEWEIWKKDIGDI